MDSSVDYTPTEVITYDKSELEEMEEPPRNVTAEDEPEQGTTDATDTSADDKQGATEDAQEPEPEPEPDRAEALQQLGEAKAIDTSVAKALGLIK